MNEQHPYRSPLVPIPPGEPRPLWSVMIPTYNCAQYLRETLTSVLAQDPGPEVMQIEVIDDHSTQDNPEAIVQELGQGRVTFYQQPQNIGYIRNFDTCLQRSRGQLVHILHGDDYVRNGFYHKLATAFNTNPELGAAFSRHIYMDERGNWDSLSSLEKLESGILVDWLKQISTGQRIATPSIVVKRDVYEKLGGFDHRFSCCGEDWEMWVRIATEYPIWFEIEPLAVYRVKRLGSLTETSVKTNQLVQDMRQATEIIESYLPQYLKPEVALQLTRQARETYAFWAIKSAENLLSTGDLKATFSQFQEAFKCSPSNKIRLWIARILVQKSMGLLLHKVRSSLTFSRKQRVNCQNANENQA